MDKILTFLPVEVPEWLAMIVAGVLALLLGYALAYLVFRLITRLINKPKASRIRGVLARLRWPLFLLLPFLCAGGVLYALKPGIVESAVTLAAGKVVFVILIAWLLIRTVNLVSALISRRFDMSHADNLRSRMVLTQIGVARRMANFFIILLAIASLFLLFDNLRGVGVSLLASAGVAGIIIGFAAQKTIANILAGIQIAMTQPIRIDDALFVENEWGWVEEITLTHVVMRLWDRRRLVLPISYFIEQPFQNWTKRSADLLGSVYLFVDYKMPLAPIREKLDEILEETDLWDGAVKVVQLLECHERTMQIRILITGRNSPETFDLRCFVRERMIDFIQKEYPHCLPVTRAIVEGERPLSEIDPGPA